MKQEIIELNKLLCKNCNETEYENCRECKVYQLVNTLAS